MDHLTATTLANLMRKNHKTIRELAAAMNITQTRLRQVRSHSVAGASYVCDWLEAITGNPRDGLHKSISRNPV